MAKKKYSNSKQTSRKSGLLNESQVRRFMGLAGIKPLNEAGIYEEDPMADEEDLEPAAGDEMGDAMGGDEMGDLPPAADDEMGDLPPAADDAMGDETVDLEAERVQEVGDNLTDALMMMKDLGYKGSAEMGEPAMDDMPPVDDVEDEAPLDDAGDVEDEAPIDDIEDEAPEDEEVIKEALRGVNIELSQGEVVNEVARRVARRILKAKRANQQMQEALGNKKPTRKAPRRHRRRPSKK